MSKLFLYNVSDFLMEISMDYIYKIFGSFPIKLETPNLTINAGDTVLCNFSEGDFKSAKQLKFLESLHCRIIVISRDLINPLILERLLHIKDCSIMAKFDLSEIQEFKSKFLNKEVFYSKNVDVHVMDKIPKYRDLEPIKIKILTLMFCNNSIKEIARELNTTEGCIRSRQNELRTAFSVQTNTELLEVVNLIM